MIRNPTPIKTLVIDPVDSQHSDDGEEESEPLHEYNERWPVVLNEGCLLTNESGEAYAIDQATRENICRHMSDEVYCSLPPGCLSDFISLNEYIAVHRELRKACYKAGMEIERDRRRQRMLSESDSEYEYRDSFWWKSLLDTPARKHYTKQRGEQRRPLLTGSELSAASAQAQEDMAKLEDARSEKEHIRHVAEHGAVDKTDYQDSGDATDSEIAEIDSLSKKLKNQTKILTDKKRLLVRGKKEELIGRRKRRKSHLKLLEREDRDKKRAEEVKKHELEKDKKAEEDRKRSLETEAPMDVTPSGDTSKDDWVTPAKKKKKKKRKARDKESPSPSSSRDP